MRVRFLGPIDRVTGSCSWFSDEQSGVQLLVDCGLVQGEADKSGWNEGKFPFDPAKLSFVVLTHAHLDHCGAIPLLYKHGFNGHVIATRETAELARLVLEDAARQPGAPFSRNLARKVRFHEPANDKALSGISPILPDVFVSFYRTGHIVGAVSVRLAFGPPKTKQKSITFSGDLGPGEEGHEYLPLLRFRMVPWPSDYAVVESTYGDKVRSPEHRELEARLARLHSELIRVIDTGGALIVPAFAIDRTQAFLVDLAEVLRRDRLGERRFESLDVVMHAPLATRVGDVYARAMRRKVCSHNGKLRPYWLGKAMFRMLGLDSRCAEDERAIELYLEQIFSSAPRPLEAAESTLLELKIPGWRRPHTVWREKHPAPLRGRPTLLVTGGGMGDGGPILGYFATELQRADVTVAFTGYLSGGTLGAALDQLSTIDAKDRLRLSDELKWTSPGGPVRLRKSDIQARMITLPGYSAHADQDGLVRWVVSEYQGRPSLAGRHVFVQHGQRHSRRALADRLEAEFARVAPSQGCAVELPDSARWFDLSTGAWSSSGAKSRAELEEENARMRERLEAAGLLSSP